MVDASIDHFKLVPRLIICGAIPPLSIRVFDVMLHLAREIPAGAGNFSLHRCVQTGSGAHLASHTMEAVHSPPSSAEVKNALSHTSTPIRLRGVVLS
jgi:hypothetical protein